MSKIKERVFGLIVVIALGVIFVPMLLENTQNPKSSVLQDVPAASLAKNETDKDQKPEVLAALNNKTDKPVVHDENQPIADRPDAKAPGLTEDLKAQEKIEAQEEEKAEELKAEQDRLRQKQEEEAKIAAQLKAEQERIDQGRRQAELEQQRAELAKLEKAKVEQNKAELVKAEEAKVAQAKAEQAKAEQAKAEQAKADQAKADQAKAEQAKADRMRAEQIKAEQIKAEQTKAEIAEHKQAAILEAKHEQNKLQAERATKKSTKVMRHGWVVQMGSFAEHRNSSALLKKLKAAGYPAFTRNVNRNGMQLTIVMVGPHARREDAQRLCSTLAMKFQIDGIIVRYEPH